MLPHTPWNQSTSITPVSQATSDLLNHKKPHHLSEAISNSRQRLNIWSPSRAQARPCEHPPLASKHQQLTALKETHKYKQAQRFRRNPKKGAGMKKKTLLGKNQPKLFQNVSFCPQPHARRWLPDAKETCCFDWALTCLKASSSVAISNRSSVQVNWDISDSETCCYYITLDWVTTLMSAYSLTSRWALQAVYLAVEALSAGQGWNQNILSGRIALQLHRGSLKRSTMTVLCAYVCVAPCAFRRKYLLELHTCTRRGAPLFTTDHIFIFSLFTGLKSDVALESLATICEAELSVRFGS